LAQFHRVKDGIATTSTLRSRFSLDSHSKFVQNEGHSDMPFPIETARFNALTRLAEDRVGNINEAEKEILRLSTSAEDSDAAKSDKRPTVRSEFIRWLATDHEAVDKIDPLARISHRHWFRGA
jgi:hypothetical protein